MDNYDGAQLIAGSLSVLLALVLARDLADEYFARGLGDPTANVQFMRVPEAHSGLRRPCHERFEAVNPYFERIRGRDAGCRRDAAIEAACLGRVEGAIDVARR